MNSSFHRPHRPDSYRRWADSVPADFRFAVKLPKEITHVRKLRDCVEPIDRFLGECGQLGDKLGPLLVQLPPSLELDSAVARGFFELVRQRVTGPVVCEPRHPTWFGDEGDDLLRRMEVARVGADPARVPEAGHLAPRTPHA
ncbi:MAG: DUF72 domain-containing protein [Gemmatimonadota bacterium]|nr:DUF72 domain-containing protein [Gemmatimonadota bacterium]